MNSKSLVNCIQYRDHSMKKECLKFDMKQFILHADMHSTHILNHIMNIRYVHVLTCSLTFRASALRQRETGLSDEGPMLGTLDYTIRIGSTPTFLYFYFYPH